MKDREITRELLDAIVPFMNDSIMEQVHFELAPCEPVDFLKRYLELENNFDFWDILENEFNIDPEAILDIVQNCF